MSVSALERVVIISGIKYYLNKNSCELSQTTLETLNIQGIAENELIAAPNFCCGYHQTGCSPPLLTIEAPIIQGILTHTMPYNNDTFRFTPSGDAFKITPSGHALKITSSCYLSELLLGKSCISKEGAKFLGRVVLQEPHLILRIVHYRGTPGDYIFKEITKDHIIQSINLNPELIKDYIFKVLKVKDLEVLFNAVLREISKISIKEIVDLDSHLKIAVDILRQVNIADSFTIAANIKKDNSEPVCLNGDKCSIKMKCNELC